MGLFSKIGKGLKNATKWVGKNVGTVAAIAAPLALTAIPGVGGALSNMASKVLGKNSGGALNAAHAATQGIAPKPDGSGGLFGKGGLFGTGMLASREWTQYNKETKWAKQDAKVLEKAAKVLGINPQSMDKLTAMLSPQELEQLKQEAHEELIAQGETPPSPNSKGSDNSQLLKWGALAAIGAKLLGVW